MPNVAELKRLRTHIRRYPEKLDMGGWVCETTACAAGRVALLNGWRPTFDSGLTHNGERESVTVVKDGVRRSVNEVAREILGLEGDGLFYSEDDELDPILTRLIEGEDG